MFRKDDRSVLFAHIPKTGGSAVEKTFAGSGWAVSYLDGKVGPGTVNHVRKCTPQHMHAEMLETVFRLDRFDAIFAIVRDPIARYRSEYLWRRRKLDEIPLAPERVERWSLAEFGKYDAWPFMWDNHLRPQVEFLLPEMMVFHFEDGLEAALRTLDSRHGLGLSVDAPAPRVRTGETFGHRSTEVPITKTLERRLREFYADDFRRLGY